MIYINMKKYIQNLKSKSEAERKQAAYMATIICMILVGGVWLYGLVNHFGKKDVNVQAQNNAKPFKLLANSIKDTYKDVSASVNQAKSISNIFNKDEQLVEDEKMIDLIPIEKNTQ